MPHHVVSGKSVEASGRTVELAIEAALARLGRPREAVEVKVLREGSKGVLGFGAQDAIVRVTERIEVDEPEAPAEVVAPLAEPVGREPVAPSPDAPVEAEPVAAPARSSRRRAAMADQPQPSMPLDEADVAAPAVPPTARAERTDGADAPARSESTPRDEHDSTFERGDVSDDELLEVSRTVLLELLQHMGILADVLATWSEPEDDKEESALILDIIGDDLGLLIGHHGDTLRDLQYLLRLLVGKRIHGWANIVVDVEGYKQRRERTLHQLAVRTAERVIATGRPTHLEPMAAYERRMIHLALRDMPEVETRSTGEGEHRKVGIFLKE